MSTSSLPHRDFAPELLERVIHRVGTVIVGKEEQIRLTLMSMLCGGHLLLEDIPGVGKTMLVRSLAACLGAGFGRIQFTYDLIAGGHHGNVGIPPAKRRIRIPSRSPHEQSGAGRRVEPGFAPDAIGAA